MRNSVFPMAVSAALAFFLSACGDDSTGSDDPSSSSTQTSSSSVSEGCSPDNGKTIQVLAPAGGDAITVSAGDTLHVRWRATVESYTGFLPQIRVDSATSAAFVELSTGSVLFEISDGDDQCFDYAWVVDTTVVAPGDYEKAVVRVRDYSSTTADYRDQSGDFHLTVER